MNYNDLLDKISSLFDWDNEEAEDQTINRFDYTTSDGQEASLWVYASGSLDGSAPKSIQKEISELDINNFLNYY